MTQESLEQDGVGILRLYDFTGPFAKAQESMDRDGVGIPRPYGTIISLRCR